MESSHIDNNAADNYWCKDCDETVEFMKGVNKPWLASKVLAAGASRPAAGFKYAFENGADFCVVGMFDFQIVDDVAAARKVLSAARSRPRPWVC